MPPKITVYTLPGCPPCDEMKAAGPIQKTLDTTGCMAAGKAAEIKLVSLEGNEDAIERFGIKEVPTAIVEDEGRRQTCSLYRDGNRMVMECSTPKKVRP